MLSQMERHMEAFGGFLLLALPLSLSLRYKMRKHRTRYGSLSAKQFSGTALKW